MLPALSPMGGGHLQSALNHAVQGIAAGALGVERVAGAVNQHFSASANALNAGVARGFSAPPLAGASTLAAASEKMDFAQGVQQLITAETAYQANIQSFKAANTLFKTLRDTLA